MNILVTGASGFIGRHLVRQLLSEGEHVHILCRPTSDVTTFENSTVNIFRGEMSRSDDVRAAMTGCDRVYHLAAFAGNWSRRPEMIGRRNRSSLETLFTTANELGVRRIVYTSTVMVFGPSNGSPVTEKTVRTLPPRTLYEALKIEAETIVEHAREQGLDIVVLHPTRVFGPGVLSEANSTTILIKQYLDGTWRLLPGDGHAAGNFVYVDDIVRGCIAAMRQGAVGGHYILGGMNLTYNELFALLADCSGVNRVLFPVPKPLAMASAHVQQALGRVGLLEPKITPAWVDVFYNDWLCRTSHAERDLDYHPTPMREALSATIAWLRSMPDREESAS